MGAFFCWVSSNYVKLLRTFFLNSRNNWRLNPPKSATMQAQALLTVPFDRVATHARGFVGWVAELLLGPLAHQHTLLAVCPNSEAVTRAALEAAAEVNAPLLFAATLNQVDLDGGYTGWTPATLARFVADELARLDLHIPVVLGLDHGGPWKKDLHARNRLSFAETVQAVLRAIEACLDAGYGLLHLDPTVDLELPPGTPVPIPRIVERTVALLRHAETYRLRRNLPPVAYEVGTEEVGGGLQAEARMAEFLDRLWTALDREGLPHPIFVVGDIGTRLDTRTFDFERACRLDALVRRYGALIKGHYTDDVDRLDLYPKAGIGGANVGPGLAAIEFEALEVLVDEARRRGLSVTFDQAIRRAVVESGRWTKWLQPEEKGRPFEALDPERQRWLVATGSRYVWTHPAVLQARRELYEALAPWLDADAFVRERIKARLMDYFRAFNLIDFNERLKAFLPE